MKNHLRNGPARDEALELAAQHLEASGRYRVLRRADLSTCLAEPDGNPTRVGMFLDIESTGLDNLNSEPIELAILPFEYRSDGAVVAVHSPLHQFNEPDTPISAEIIRLTGITNDMVAGHRINTAAVETFIAECAFIIAHNAAFDRPIAERISSVFSKKPWVCSMADIDWKSEGIEGRRLSDLLHAFGFFFESHRAFDDCEAGVALLTQTGPRSGRRVLDLLLSTARTPSWRIFAVDAPFDFRDSLRQRGYRWNTRQSFGPRAWWIDLDTQGVEIELQFLANNIFRRQINIPIHKITAYNRYSSRLQLSSSH